MAAGPERAGIPGWARWTGGCLFAVGATLLGLVAMVMLSFQPTVTARFRSPDGRWRARLERLTGGGRQAIYYSVHARRWWPFAADCLLADVEGEEAADYVRLDWPARDRVVIRYGLSRFDRKREGEAAIDPPTADCGALRATARHDPALDAAATRANADNGRIDNPPKPDPFENVVVENAGV